MTGNLQGVPDLVRQLRGDRRGGEAARFVALWNLASDEPLKEPSADEECVQALSHRARRAFMSVDEEALAAAIQTLAQRHRDSPEHTLWRGFQEVLFGETPDPASGADLHRAARKRGDAVVAVDSVTLQGACALARGQLKEALGHVRRAARMAQSEHMWLPHYFASLFLARLRRLMGQPHLAVRIVDACRRVTPAPWQGWLRWERVCAGAPRMKSPASSSPIARSAIALSEWIAAPPPKTDLIVDGCVGASAFHRQDIEAASAGLDVHQRPALGTAMHDWIYGVESSPPPSMRGFLALSLQDEGAATAGGWVVSGPEFSPRRIIDVALPAEFARVPRCDEQGTRVATLVSALCLAGTDGLSRGALFEQIYGFAFRPDTHEGAFRVLRHHASSHLRPFAATESDGERHRILPHKSFAILDPRTVRPMKDVMLRYLARAGGSGARDVAKQMGVPLRTVQTALKELVGDGACASERVGRNVVYEVEDTTFMPLTMA